MLPPTIPNEPISRSAGEFTFIEPARDPVDAGRAAEHLVEQLLRVDAERERVTVPAVRRRCAVRSSRTLATPVAIASCPEYRCVVP